MNPHQCRLALRVRDPFEVLDVSLRLIRERSGPLLRLGALLLLPAWAACGLFAWAVDGRAVALLPPLLMAAVIQAPFTLLVGRLLFAEEVAVGQVLRDLSRRLPHLLAAWMVKVFGFVLTAGSCLLAAPLVQPGLLYVTETALLEGVRPQRAVNRAMRLAGAGPGAALVGALSWLALTAWLGLVGEATGQAVVGFVLQLGEPFGSLYTDGSITPYLVGGMLLAQPLHAIYRLLLYVDARTRAEGWDLQVSLRAAGMGR